MPLYSQGYSVARYLIAQGGQRKFIGFLEDGLARGDWNGATREHYGYETLGHFQVAWLDWVKRGSPPLKGLEAGPGDNAPQVAQASTRRGERSPIYRGQSQDPSPPASVYAAKTRLRSTPKASPEQPWPAEAAEASDRGHQPQDPPREAPRAKFVPRSRGMEPPRDELLPGPADEPAPAAEPAATVEPTSSRSRPREVILEWTRPER
jgi:hypothetical protein